jgi:hypothetical protein
VTRIEEIATKLAARAIEDKHRPYNTLKWLAFNHLPPSLEPLAAEVYFAATNILKAKGVENAKRKPLTNLSKEDRALMRKRAKELATMLQQVLNIPCAVTSAPIKSDGDVSRIQIEIRNGESWCSFVYPVFGEIPHPPCGGDVEPGDRPTEGNNQPSLPPA